MGLDSSNRDINSQSGNNTSSILQQNQPIQLRSYHRRDSQIQTNVSTPPGEITMEQNNGKSSASPRTGNNGEDEAVDGESKDDKPENNNGFGNGKRKSSRRRISSSEDSGDDSDTSSALEREAPDGGWGWVVVAAAFLVNLVADGVTFSFGVYYAEFLKVFGQSKSATSWIGSLLAAMPLLSGPIASSLTDRYGCRKVTIAGSILSSLGFLLSSYADSVVMLYFTFGILTGFGLSLCYVAAVVIVAYYFEDRRSLATGISVCGGGIGTFIFAPLIQHLIDEYEWQKATRVLAAAFICLSICGLVMRDLEWTKKSRRMRRQNNNSPSLDSSSSEEITFSKPRRLCNSALCIPTFVQEQERLARSKAANPSSQRRLFQSHPTSFPNNDSPTTRLSDSTLGTNSPRQKTVSESEAIANPGILTATNAVAITPHAVNFAVNGDGIAANGTPNKSSYNSPANKNLIYNQPLSSTMNSPGVGIHRYSLTYRGAVLSLKRYRLRPASSCPDIISVATTDDRSSHEWKAVMADLCKWCKALFEWKALSTSRRFILFVISNFLLYMWYDVIYMYLQEAAQDVKYDDEQSSYLISILGLFNMVGNLTLGYMGDKEWIDASLIYGICMILCGFSAIILPTVMAWGYVPLALDCGLYGLAIAANYSLTSVILVKVVSLERFASAYGLLLLVQGIGNLIGPPIAGLIYDWTGTSSLSFVIAGIGIILSSVFVIVPKIIKCSNHIRYDEDEEEEDKIDQA